MSRAPQTLKKAMRLLDKAGQPAKVTPLRDGYTLEVEGKCVQYDKCGRLVHDEAL